LNTIFVHLTKKGWQGLDFENGSHWFCSVIQHRFIGGQEYIEMLTIQLEVCIDSVQSACEAELGGANVVLLLSIISYSFSHCFFSGLSSVITFSRGAQLQVLE
jgi:hypothetical protein